MRTLIEGVVDHPEDLTGPWLSDALGTNGNDFLVEDVHWERIGTGQMGTTYRLHLTYRGPQGPATLVAKLAGEDESSRALVAPGYAAEVGFYTALRHELVVRTPRCWYGAITADRTRFTLLLDDISSASPGVQVRGCTVEQASVSLRNLVGLHTPKWGDPSLWDLEFLLRPDEEMAAMLGEVMSSATQVFVQRYAEELTDAEARILRETSEVIEPWQLTRTNPFSVIHGDYRLDNLLFDGATGDVTVVDWQTAAIGPPLRDVAYFLGSSLRSEDRQAHEERLVHDYHAGILDRGIVDYDTTRCWDDYRLGHLQGPMITILGCIYASADRSKESDAMFLAMARRSCAAIRDLGSLDLV